MTKARLYYEAHITVEVRGDGTDWDWSCFKAISPYWKCSKFDQDDVDGYHDKWFMSTRHDDLDQLKARIQYALEELKNFSFEVVRWKIEDTLLDSKCGDTLE